MKAKKLGYGVAYGRTTVRAPPHVSLCQMSGYFGGKAYGHPRLVKQRQPKSQYRRKRKAENVSVLSKVLSLD